MRKGKVVARLLHVVTGRNKETKERAVLTKPMTKEQAKKWRPDRKERANYEYYKIIIYRKDVEADIPNEKTNGVKI